jgi:hypothetical protein
VLERSQTGDVFGRLDADAHFVAVVGAGFDIPCTADPTIAQDAPALSDRLGQRRVRFLAADTPITAKLMCSWRAFAGTTAIPADRRMIGTRSALRASAKAKTRR